MPFFSQRFTWKIQTASHSLFEVGDPSFSGSAPPTLLPNFVSLPRFSSADLGHPGYDTKWKTSDNFRPKHLSIEATFLIFVEV